MTTDVIFVFSNAFALMVVTIYVDGPITIFGGIVRCDRVAHGVVQAVKELGLDVPVVVRLEGTNADEAQLILEESGVSIIPAKGMKDAAEKVVNDAMGS